MSEMAKREKVSFLTKKKVKKRARTEVKKCPRCEHWSLMKSGKISCDSSEDTQVWYCKWCGFRKLRRISKVDEDVC